MGCDDSVAREALTKKSFVVGNETVAIEMSEEEADRLKSLVLCTVYSRLWLWVSGKLNQLCKTETEGRLKKLYLLDISGLETTANVS